MELREKLDISTQIFGARTRCISTVEFKSFSTNSQELGFWIVSKDQRVMKYAIVEFTISDIRK